MTEVSTAGTGGTAAGPGTDDATPPAPRWRDRPWVRALGVGLLAGAAAAVLLPVAVIAPYLRDDLRLDRIVRAVALDWRDFGEQRARERLEYELDHQQIGAWVADDDCALAEGDGARTVRCAWGVTVSVPFTELVVPLSFASEAVVDRSGDLR
jgi:hypothetical protein